MGSRHQEGRSIVSAVGEVCGRQVAQPAEPAGSLHVPAFSIIW